MPERRTTDPATTDETTQRTVESKAETEQEKKSWFDLSVTQVVGGALAAMTAAALGSRFSAAGTLVGAALVSAITAVAGALYTASLRRTHQTVRVVLGGQPTQAAGIGSSSTPAKPLPGGSTAVSPRSLPDLDGTAETSTKASRRRTLLVKAVVGAVATFALAAGALTLYEVLTGHALSGGSGTTFSQVQQDGPKERPTQAPTPSESAEPSATEEPTAEPSATSEAEPSPTEEPSAERSAEPSAEASAEPSVTPDAEPSATAAQPSTAPSQGGGQPR